MPGYQIHEPCIGGVYTNDLRKLTIRILAGSIIMDQWFTVSKIIAPTRECLVEDGDYVRIIQEVRDTLPESHRRGVLFVSCEKLKTEAILDWNHAYAFQGLNFLGASTAKFYVKVDEYCCFQDIQLKKLGSKDLEYQPIRFEVVGDEVHFFVSPKEGFELSGALGLDIGAWPLAWQGIPGSEDAKRKWLIAQRSGSRTAIRA